MINQKKIYSLLLLLILVVPMLISPNQYQVDGEIEELSESINNIPAIDPISNDVNPSTPATKQS
ncbi:MAG: hypothetical protein KAU62_16445, partial [Candidatus Heimdallarchaeota archaeon]|nr:hypothetical protein [Candidatus Heimdallarchaeota archaeon]MCK4612746.1 hypothetical protein [Candidatus Heimdallarchaeota archaeon]